MLSWLARWKPVPPLPALGWTGIAFLAGPVAWTALALLVVKTEYGARILAAYLLWMFLDRRSCVNNTRRWRWLRGLSWWKRHADYFPIRLVTTSDLPRDRNYLLALFPHGVFSLSLMTALTTDALGFESAFPGLRVACCTLNAIFHIPFIRDLALGVGFSCVSEESLNEMLGGTEKGRAVGVVVGGAAEAAFSKQNRYKILLSRRKGFCKVALRNGCDIVPVYSFGESDLYDVLEPEPGSLLDRVQTWVKDVTTIIPVVFRGAGPLGLFPRRLPVTVVVGKPIRVTKTSSPTRDEVEALHGRFTREMRLLFDEYKGKYLTDKSAQLVIC